MNKDAIVFACANPTPEIFPEDAKAGGAKVISTGRSDYPNQINNVLAFPGIFRGALDVRASDINEEMKMAAAMALVDSAELSVDTEASAASLARAGMEVDLGAVAKGFAAREAEAAIRDAGGTSAMLDLGGNVTVIGAKEDGSPWRVAVKDPRDTGSYLCVLALTDVTLSTSGGYERYFEEDGVRYHHIIDPRTGYPAENGLISVTIILSLIHI